MATPALRPLSTGEILDVSFGIYRSRFSALFLVAVSSQVLPIALRFAMGDGTEAFSHPWLALASLVVAMVMSSLGLAACTLIVSRSYLGQSISAGEALKAALPLIGTLIVIAFLQGLAVIAGLILLIFPALIFAVAYMLASAVAVIEAPIKATDAMSRSWHLTKGHRWRIFVAVMVPVLLLMVPGVALGTLAAIASVGSQTIVKVATGVISVFFYPFLYVVVSVCYYDLRIRKEGFDLELLAAAAAE